MMYGALALALAGLPAALAANHTVTVGANNGLTFTPETLTGVVVDDWVIFNFVSKNHTATQASFDQPCAPLAGGFNSGFQPAASGPKTFSFHVTDVSKPIWVNCQQTGHCQQGMVFAINAPDDPAPNSFSKFKAKATGASSGGDDNSQCPPTDNAGSPLTSTDVDNASDGPFIVCNYQQAGRCEYFQGGGFSSGGSVCPAKINPPSTSTTSGDSTSTGLPGGDNWTTPPPQSWTTATTVVSSGTSTWTTTWTSYAGTPPPTFAPSPQNIKVTVGSTDGTQLVFTKNDIKAAINDVVTFEFSAKNHSVYQSTFSAPCVPKEGGFQSDFFPTPVGTTTDLKTFSITINDTAPIWGYCAQTIGKVHCGAGMVFSINAVDDGPNSFTNFQILAERINGTSSSSGSPSGSPSPSPSPGAAVGGVQVHGVAAALSLVALVSFLL